MSNNTMDTLAILETVSMRWELEDPPTIAQIKERGGDTSDLYRRVRQISRAGQPSEVVAISYRLLHRDTMLDDYEEPTTIYIKPLHAELSDVTLDVLGLTREQFNERAIPFADSAAVLKQAFSGMGTLPIWATWGHYPLERLRKDYARVKAKYPFSSRHINLKTVAGLVLGGEDMPLKEVLDALEQASGYRLPERGRGHIDNLNSITDVACFFFGGEAVYNGRYSDY